MNGFLERLKRFLKGLEIGMREVSTSLIEKELEEYENVFALITMGIFSGIPSPPTGIILRLIPHMQREMYVMLKRSADLDDVFAETLSHFDLG
jgi:hypothetical protein